MAWEEIIFPNNIRNIRMSIGMKMTDLAKRTKLSLSAVSKIEKGVRRLNKNQLIDICGILGCKLQEIFIKESDEVAGIWQGEIFRRTNDNEGGGLKIFGSGLRKIRQNSGKTIAIAAKESGMTLSVYHKIEVGQREVYQSELEPLAKSFGFTTESFLDEIARLYKAGDLNKPAPNKNEKSVLLTGEGLSAIDLPGCLYGAKLYDSARRKLVPVFGTPDANGIRFIKSDKTMIVAPIDLEGIEGIYAVIPNTLKNGVALPEKSYIFADSNSVPVSGDMAISIDSEFNKLTSADTAKANIVMLRSDSKGKIFAINWNTDEKVSFKSLHKIVTIILE